MTNEHSSSYFPWEIKELDLELDEELKRYYGNKTHVGYVQVGPSRYLLNTPYRQLAASVYNMPLLPTDTFVVSVPRSGTTWTQELVWLVLNDLDYTTARSVPLADRYVFLEPSMLFDENAKKEVIKDVNQLEILKNFITPGPELLAATPSPRFVKTHLPLSLLPPPLLDTTRVVYIARDPRDVVVSYYHFVKSNNMLNFLGDFKVFFDRFINGLLIWTPYFDHVKEAWKQRHHPNMLFLFYEELIKDLPGTAQRVSQFFGKQYSRQQLAELAQHLHFDSFKNNSSVNLAVTLKNTGVFDDNFIFVRKGKSGGWREFFDAELSERAARWVADQLRGSDLVFTED